MAHIVAIANQKGGVGKTTTAVNLAASLAIAERRTLLLDADPQGNATSGLGIAKHELEISLYDALVDGRSASEVIMPVPGLPHLSALPATQDLVGAELQLVERAGRESALRKVLDQIEGDYEYVVIDCPPSLGLLTLNVLASAHAVLIPIQCEYYGLEGISQLLNTIRLVQQNFNPGLAISGVLLTMYDARLNLCRQVAEDAKEYFGAKMFLTAIPRNVRLAEAPSFGKPILLYDVQSVGAKSYIAVAQELMRRVEGNATRDPIRQQGASAVSDSDATDAETRSAVSQTLDADEREPRSTESSKDGSRSATTTGERDSAREPAAMPDPRTAVSEPSPSEAHAPTAVAALDQSSNTPMPDAHSPNAQVRDAQTRHTDRHASEEALSGNRSPEASETAPPPAAVSGTTSSSAGVTGIEAPNAEAPNAEATNAEAMSAEATGATANRAEATGAESSRTEASGAEAFTIDAREIEARQERTSDAAIRADASSVEADAPRQAQPEPQPEGAR